MHIAIPMPPPMHSVARPFLASRFCISCSNGTSTRAPDAPTGWPIAIAPPLTLTLEVSQPRSLLTAQAWAAKASLASIRSRSPMLQPAFFSAAREAGSGAVIDTRGRAGGDCAVLLEGGLQLRHGIEGGAVTRILVVGHDDVALAGLDGDGDDLVLELAGLLRGLRLVLRMHREFVLLGAGDLVLPGDVLGGVAHVIAVEGIPQAVLDHGVDELERSHFYAATQILRVRGHAHGFLAAGDDDFRIAIEQRLVTQRHRAQARAAQLVDAPGRAF